MKNGGVSHADVGPFIERRERAKAQQSVGSALADLVGNVLARPFDPSATYAVSGTQLNQIVRDMARADAYLEEIVRTAYTMRLTDYGAQVAAHVTRSRQTSGRLVAQATAIAPRCGEGVA